MNNTTYPFTLLYDRNCLICKTEMDALHERDAGLGRLRFVDISEPGFDPAPYGRTLAELNAVIHGVTEHGDDFIISVEKDPNSRSATGG